MNNTFNYTVCYDKGLLLPILNDSTWSVGARAFLYMSGMLWCFLGIALVSDSFMCGIDHITSKTRTISIPKHGGEGFKQIQVKVWNDTVANLTLLAFGTSAPEILLNVIDTCGHTFRAGSLGPGTIVGSAAFNLFVITSLSIICIPKGETRKIKNLQVFALTSIFGIFAYIWLILVLLVISPEVVDLWEAIVTFLMFPVLILTSYVADKGIWCSRNKTSAIDAIGQDCYEIDLDRNNSQRDGTADLIEVARRLAKDKSITEDDVAQAMAARVVSGRSKTSSWYRVNATRMLTGGPKLSVKPKKNVTELLEKVHILTSGVSKLNNCVANGVTGAVSSHEVVLQHKRAIIEFTAETCSVLENEGSVRIGVKRTGDLSKEVKIGIETVDGTAVAGEDYKYLKQLLTFSVGEITKEVFVEIVDDDMWEPDEYFFLKLFYHTEGSTNESVEIGHVGVMQITIVNDDEPGQFEFSKPSYSVKESVDCVSLVIRRVNGADGKVEVTWTTADMTARSQQEYGGGQGRICFNHGETSKILNIDIFGIKNKQQEPTFIVELTDPTGGAQIGKISKCVVTIINDEEFNSMLSRIANKTQKNLDVLQLDTNTWSDQFRSAMNVNGGNLEDATFIDYILHFVTFFWKVLFAFLPPPSLGGGWPIFISSLLVIALLTAIVSDMATIFGCLLGVSDYITAITFVALGTSVPDAFASKCAAINEKWADSAIGNINGSNSVNIFLGLGLPWLLASIYWNIKGQDFHHPTGTVGFSVTLFTVCAVMVLLVLVVRRLMTRFGCAELGGPTTEKYLTGMIPLGIWVLYVCVSTLQAQGVITAF